MPDIDRRALIAGVSLVGAMALSRAAKAGQLVPPVGPVAETGRSLRDVEPRTPISSLAGGPDAVAVISQPGAYVLTGELLVPVGKSGIQVTASGPVSIDLRGFAITGTPGTPGSLRGIECVSPLCTYLEVYDGFIRDCGGDGIDGGDARFLEVDDVHVTQCASGIRKALGRLKCSDITLERMAGHGLVYAPSSGMPGTVTSLECVIDDCEISDCGGSGISIEGDYTDLDCSIWICDCDCHGNGLDGVGGTFGSIAPPGGINRATLTIDECNCAGNGRFGIGVDAPINPVGLDVSVVLECGDNTCAHNVSDGLRVSNVLAAICDCDCVSNGGNGMVCESVSGSIECCLCSNNLGHGMIATNVQAAIEEVDCRSNGGDGMACASVSGSVECCECSGNGGAGLRLTGACVVCVCECGWRGNAAEGLFADGSCTGLSITECDARSNGTGIRVDGSNNLLLWNTATGNSANYVFDSASSPTVVIAPSDLAANMNPHANYSF